MNLLEKGIRARDVVTRKSLENAARVVACTGGSTNAGLHLPAIAHEAGIEFYLDDVCEIFKDTPYFVDLKPGGQFVAKDLYEVGGVPVVMKELRKAGLIHEDCVTADGITMGEALDKITREADGRVIYPVDKPLSKTGGVVGLKGNLAPAGAIVKVAGMSEEQQVFTGPARVFECEKTPLRRAATLLQRGRSDRHPQRRTCRWSGHARDAGDHGGAERSGHGQEGGADHRWPLLGGDARFLCRPCRPRIRTWRPDRALQNGDMITINALAGDISVDLSDDELAQRKGTWAGPRQTIYASGALWKYAQLVGETYKGAVTHPGGGEERHVYADL